LNSAVGGRDVVEVDGRRVRAQGLAYVLLHKPAGVVTTMRDPGRRGPGRGRQPRRDRGRRS
jgi:16S rRNA U516 pseudouridylate synthase RsuA-like enzyme